jgi:hypothetical protein
MERTGPRGISPSHSTIADVSPDAIRITGDGASADPLVLKQAAVHLFGRWLVTGTDEPELCRQRHRIGPRGSRPEVHAQVQGMLADLPRAEP